MEERTNFEAVEGTEVQPTLIGVTMFMLLPYIMCIVMIHVNWLFKLQKLIDYQPIRYRSFCLCFYLSICVSVFLLLMLIAVVFPLVFFRKSK